MTWNEDRERIIAAAELGDATPKVAADLLVAARKRAFDAEQRAQQLQTEVEALKAAHTWIKPSDRMPEGSCDVLGVVKGTLMLLTYAPDDDPDRPWLDENIGCYPTSYVTHWQPLPEPPK